MFRTNIYIKYFFVFVFFLFVSSGVKAAELELWRTGKVGATGYKKLPTIVVSGDKDRYSEILTDTLTYNIIVKIRYDPKHDKGPSYGTIVLENSHVDISPSSKKTTYEISIPYTKPITYKSGISPIDHCNAWLDGKTGTQKKEALKKGTTKHIKNAYKATASSSYYHRKSKLAFWKKKTTKKAEIYLPVNVRCQNLSGPKPRKKSSTRKHQTGRKGVHYPTITKLTLRVEPGQKELIDGQICPTKAYLYGYIESFRSVKGSAVFFGTDYISRITKINLYKQDQRSVKATYPIKWTSTGVKKTIADNSTKKDKLKTKSFDITLNISNEKNVVIKSTGKKSFTVTCKEPKVNPVVEPSKSKIKYKAQ